MFLSVLELALHGEAFFWQQSQLMPMETKTWC
jgi:hypothetical protein